MAAVLALIFLPVIASVGVMVQIIRGDLGFGPGLALMCFCALALGVFGGLLTMSRRWENEPG